jgi:hypothetical protein
MLALYCQVEKIAFAYIRQENAIFYDAIYLIVN